MAITPDSRGIAEFERFVRANEALFRRYVARKLSGSQVSVDDTLQEGLERIWKAFQKASWPSEPAAKAQFAHQLLKCAAIDAIRGVDGRGGTRRGREILIDHRALDGAHTLDGAHNDDHHGVAVAAIHRMLVRRAAEERDVDADAAVVLGAIAALTADELRIVYLAAAGFDHKEIAARLGLTHQAVRSRFVVARQLVRELVACALGDRAGHAHRQRVYDYLDGRLGGRAKRLAERHLRCCPSCRRSVELEREAVERATRILSGLPWLGPLGLLGSSALAGAAAAAGVTAAPGAVAAPGAAPGAAAAPGGAAAVGGHTAVLAGAGAKLCVAGALLAAAGLAAPRVAAALLARHHVIGATARPARIERAPAAVAPTAGALAAAHVAARSPHAWPVRIARTSARPAVTAAHAAAVPSSAHPTPSTNPTQRVSPNTAPRPTAAGGAGGAFSLGQ